MGTKSGFWAIIKKKQKNKKTKQNVMIFLLQPISLQHLEYFPLADYLKFDKEKCENLAVSYPNTRWAINSAVILTLGIMVYKKKRKKIAVFVWRAGSLMPLRHWLKRLGNFYLYLHLSMLATCWLILSTLYLQI